MSRYLVPGPAQLPDLLIGHRRLDALHCPPIGQSCLQLEHRARHPYNPKAATERLSQSSGQEQGVGGRNKQVQHWSIRPHGAWEGRRLQGEGVGSTVALQHCLPGSELHSLGYKMVAASESDRGVDYTRDILRGVSGSGSGRLTVILPGSPRAGTCQGSSSIYPHPLLLMPTELCPCLVLRSSLDSAALSCGGKRDV